MYYECGDIYEGEWVNDKKEGEGIIRYSKKTLLFLIWQKKPSKKDWFSETVLFENLTDFFK